MKQKTLTSLTVSILLVPAAVGQLKDSLLYSVNLAGAPGMTEGVSRVSVSCAGDWDGDGTLDVLLFSQSIDDSRVLIGQVRILKGGGDGVLWDSKQSVNNVLCVERVGDLSEDGKDDLALCVGQLESSVRLVEGGSGEVFKEIQSDFPSRVVWDGDGIAYGFGSRLARIGDVDGDGWGDIVVGSPEQRIPVAPEDAQVGKAPVWANGVVEVRSGRSGAMIWRKESLAAEHGFGSAVVAIPDCDGDGTEDVAIGSPPGRLMLMHNDSQYGSVFVLSGASGATLSGWKGATNFEGLGRSVFPIGDADGDGSPDLAVGVAGILPDPFKLVIQRTSGGDVIRSLDSDALGSVCVNRSMGRLGDIDGSGITAVAVFPGLRGMDQGVCKPVVEILSPRSGGVLGRITLGGEARPVCCEGGDAGDVDRDGRDDVAIVTMSSDRKALTISVYGFRPR